MPYTVPSGWIERLDDPTDVDSQIRVRFHLRADCPRIRHPEALTRVDRPGSAAVCRTCLAKAG